jgi:uncharacterized protein
MPQFEFDPAKSALNKLKHGIDFKEAQGIWKDPKSIEAPAIGVSEPRFQVLGRALGKLWSAIITYRHGTIRIVSVRRARERERQKYEEIARKKEKDFDGRTT